MHQEKMKNGNRKMLYYGCSYLQLSGLALGHFGLPFYLFAYFGMWFSIRHHKVPKISCGDAAEQKLQTLWADISLHRIKSNVKWTSLNSSTEQTTFIHKGVYTLLGELNLPTFWPLWHYKRCAVDTVITSQSHATVTWPICWNTPANLCPI